MAERWVLNASPFIILARAGYEHLLWELPDETVVPHAVVAEIEAGPIDDPARQAIAKHFLMVNVTPAPEILAWDLGAGETAVLSYALRHPGWIAILDDAAARKGARGFGLRFKGTLAVVIVARQRGLIPQQRMEYALCWKQVSTWMSKSFKKPCIVQWGNGGSRKG